MIKALIFDFDGTIANTLPACFNAFKRTVEPVLGKEMSLQEIRSYVGPKVFSLNIFLIDKMNLRKYTTKSMRKNKPKSPILFRA